MHFAHEKLKGLRLARGLSRAQLGELLGVSPHTVRGWERGLRTPLAQNLLPLARHLHVTVADLFEGGPRG